MTDVRCSVGDREGLSVVGQLGDIQRGEMSIGGLLARGEAESVDHGS